MLLVLTNKENQPGKCHYTTFCYELYGFVRVVMHGLCRRHVVSNVSTTLRKSHPNQLEYILDSYNADKGFEANRHILSTERASQLSKKQCSQENHLSNVIPACHIGAGSVSE